MKIATAQQMREMDRITIQERGVPSTKLMETAARAVAGAALEAARAYRGGEPRRAVCFCGSNLRQLLGFCPRARGILWTASVFFAPEDLAKGPFFAVFNVANRKCAPSRFQDLGVRRSASCGCSRIRGAGLSIKS